LIVKPVDGAGGDDVVLCRNFQQLETVVADPKNANAALRLERYIAGTSVSVSVVRNQHETRLLPATKQQFSNTWHQPSPSDSDKTAPEPIGHFVKSVYPLENSLQHRAEALAVSVADAFPTWRGYLGIDMVLADEASDVVVELNPRLTASYPTVRAETGFNLMEFLLKGK
jgi:predicted ATP-grasp superfamily ATP-dependent carboligase